MAPLRWALSQPLVPWEGSVGGKECRQVPWLQPSRCLNLSGWRRDMPPAGSFSYSQAFGVAKKPLMPFETVPE